MIDPRAIAQRVRDCPGVAGLSGGAFGIVATYVDGERLVGVAVRERDVDVAIIARAGHPLPALADEIRQAVADLTGDRPVNIRIDDLELEDSA